MSGAGYNDQGEIHIHKCDSLDRARESIFSVLEVRSFIADDDSSRLLSIVIILEIPEKSANFLAISVTVVFPRWTLDFGDSSMENLGTNRALVSLP